MSRVRALARAWLHNNSGQVVHSHVPITTHTHPFNGPLSKWASTRKVKPMYILLKQETVTGSGIRWAICQSAFRSRQITTPAPHHSVFYRPDALPAAQPTASKHWRHIQVTPAETTVFISHLEYFMSLIFSRCLLHLWFCCWMYYCLMFPLICFSGAGVICSNDT